MKTTLEIMKETHGAASAIMNAGTDEKNKILECMAESLLNAKSEILAANETDAEEARGKISEVMLDRLRLSSDRINSMAKGILDVRNLPDPAWRKLEIIKRSDGMTIEKTAVPLGVIAIIYESRPNVTSDAAALCIKSGNAVILRGGREAYRSSTAITAALKKGCAAAGFPMEIIGQVEDTTRQSSIDLMRSYPRLR